MPDEWDSLNKRQQFYMQAIFEQDQAQEQYEKMRYTRGERSRPADEWRWIEYADTLYGYTPLKGAIKDAKLVDQGTGSTFKALKERGYILADGNYFGGTVNVKLTPKGRKLVRQSLSIPSATKFPVGTLREWHWRALCRAYVCGDEGIGYDTDSSDSFGYVSWKTCLRLRDYTIKGQDRALIKEQYLVGYGKLTITEFGKQYYQENWQRYKEMYPEVDAPEPSRSEE